MRNAFVLLCLVLPACGTSAIEVPEPYPVPDPTEEQLCSVDRYPGDPCSTADGGFLFHGECCVDAKGYLGTCMRVGPDGGDLERPWCNTVW